MGNVELESIKQTRKVWFIELEFMSLIAKQATKARRESELQKEQPQVVLFGARIRKQLAFFGSTIQKTVRKDGFLYGAPTRDRT